MFELNKVVEGSNIVIDNLSYKVLGKTFYVTEKGCSETYAKILLNNHNVLVVSLTDGVAYFGKNKGRLVEFDGYPETVNYDGAKYEKVSHDYQIVTKIEFGSPLEVEGEVEYWSVKGGAHAFIVIGMNADDYKAHVQNFIDTCNNTTGTTTPDKEPVEDDKEETESTGLKGFLEKILERLNFGRR